MRNVFYTGPTVRPQQGFRAQIRIKPHCAFPIQAGYSSKMGRWYTLPIVYSKMFRFLKLVNPPGGILYRVKVLFTWKEIQTKLLLQTRESLHIKPFRYSTEPADLVEFTIGRVYTIGRVNHRESSLAVRRRKNVNKLKINLKKTTGQNDLFWAYSHRCDNI